MSRLVSHSARCARCGSLAASRRWTGIEPAARGSPVPPALKAGAATRSADTSADDRSFWARLLRNAEVTVPKTGKAGKGSGSDGEQVAGAGVGRRVPQLRHGP